MAPSTIAPSKNFKRAVAAMAVACSASTVGAFAPQPQCTSRASSTAIYAETGRREMLRNVFGAAVGIAAAGVVPGEASASYSAYTAREKDWQERKESGDIQISTARDLRQQLREIVPQNSENSKVFCPNGPSAAVSPLMENKCGDRLATPSVFGRTEDITGNSIPGFKGGKYPGSGPGDTSSLNAQLGSVGYGFN